MPEPQVTAPAPAAPAAPETSYMQTLTGASDGESLNGLLEGKRPEPAAEQVTADAVSDPEVAESTGDPEIDDFLKELAAENGLQDPNVLSILGKVVKDPKLLARLQTNAGKNAGEQQEEQLTELEKSLAEAATAEADGEKKAPAAAEPAAQGQTTPFADLSVGAKWTSHDDALNDLVTAWGDSALQEKDPKAYFARVNDIESAMWATRMRALGTPMVEHLVQQKLQQLGLDKMMPVLQESVAAQNQQRNKQAAIDGVSRLFGYENFSEMFNAEEGKAPIIFKGEEFPSTPYNRIIAKYPEILDIKKSHSDPNIAEQLTLTARYKAAAKLHRSEANSIAPSNAKKIMDAGAQLQQRQLEDKTRQAINAGPGATGVGGKTKTDSYMSSLVKPGAELSVNDLFS